MSLNRGMKEGQGVGPDTREFNDNSKLELLKRIPHDHTFGRTRKQADLSSQPIYDLSFKEPSRNKNSFDTYIPSHPFS